MQPRINPANGQPILDPTPWVGGVRPFFLTSSSQFRSVPHVTDPQLGDLIFYGEPATKIHHVGLYIGNQQMIDAPQTGQAVQVHTYRRDGDDYAGAGRPTQ